jgi:hypothetical protein
MTIDKIYKIKAIIRKEKRKIIRDVKIWVDLKIEWEMYIK